MRTELGSVSSVRSSVRGVRKAQRSFYSLFLDNMGWSSPCNLGLENFVHWAMDT